MKTSIYFSCRNKHIMMVYRVSNGTDYQAYEFDAGDPYVKDMPEELIIDTPQPLIDVGWNGSQKKQELESLLLAVHLMYNENLDESTIPEIRPLVKSIPKKIKAIMEKQEESNSIGACLFSMKLRMECIGTIEEKVKELPDVKINHLAIFGNVDHLKILNLTYVSV